MPKRRIRVRVRPDNPDHYYAEAWRWWYPFWTYVPDSFASTPSEAFRRAAVHYRVVMEQAID